jgi:hypothetical protein
LSDVLIPFEHRQTAHCESGVVSRLLTHGGLPLSEAMAFGAGGGLTYAYLPFVKFGGLPLFAFRMPPKAIMKGVQKRLGVKFKFETFSDPDAGMAALDRHLAEGRVVGLQTNVFWLPYFPPDMRFHFNAHNILVHGKQGNDYLVSDPTMDVATVVPAEDLKKARSVKGTLAPKSLLYYPTFVPKPGDVDWARAVRDSLKFTSGMMLYTPLPIIGVWGIRTVAKVLRKLPTKDLRWVKLYIGHMVRMQEEIGTGGAGFRFLFASFLQEAAAQLNKPGLAESAVLLTEAGDQWRQFGLSAAKMCKDRLPLDLNALADQLLVIADLEKKAFKHMRAQA